MRVRRTEYLQTDHGRLNLSFNATQMRIPRRILVHNCAVPGCYRKVGTVYCMDHYPRLMYCKPEYVSAYQRYLAQFKHICATMADAGNKVQWMKAVILYFDFATLNYHFFRLEPTDYDHRTLYNDACREIGTEFSLRYAFLQHPRTEEPPRVDGLYFHLRDTGPEDEPLSVVTTPPQPLDKDRLNQKIIILGPRYVP